MEILVIGQKYNARFSNGDDMTFIYRGDVRVGNQVLHEVIWSETDVIEAYELKEIFEFMNNYNNWSPGLESLHEEKFIEDDLVHLVDLLGISADPDKKAALRMTLRECYREGFKRGVEHGERLFKPVK